ncbi:hypothetical protein ACIRRH_42240 [Kitasatospora sp. NPDC101235]|uniref:hypothetical protein n=1 Tax=Kitasatospora sp. NPDC101235 TaxID=3364101 RepID=UPI00381E03AE
MAGCEGQWLGSLVGERVTGAWGVWIGEEGEWFADLPALLAIGGRQVAVCVNRLDLLSATPAAIDTGTAPTWWNDWSLTWRSDAHPVLDEVVGRTVTAVGVTEWSPGLAGAGGGQHPPAWMLTGFALELGDTALWVYNAADENGLQLGWPPKEEHYRTSWFSNPL